MARTSGTWRKGQGGKPKGAKDKLPRSFKASVAAIFAEVASADPGLIRSAIEKGLKSSPPRSYQYLALAGAYIDGKPKDVIQHENPDGSALTPAVVFYLPANARDAVVSTST